MDMRKREPQNLYFEAQGYADDSSRLDSVDGEEEDALCVPNANLEEKLQKIDTNEEEKLKEKSRALERKNLQLSFELKQNVSRLEAMEVSCSILRGWLDYNLITNEVFWASGVRFLN